MFFQETISVFFAKAQKLFDKSERAWAAACDAWNEDISNQAQSPLSTTEEPQQTRSTNAAVSRIESRTKQIKPEASNKPKNKAKKTARLGPLTEIVIQQHDKALNRAHMSSNCRSDNSRLILWTDASVAGQRSGCAVAFQYGHTWVRVLARKSGTHINPTMGELYAIDYALDYALQVALQRPSVSGLRAVEIFSDSQASLSGLSNTTRATARATRKKASRLKQEAQQFLDRAAKLRIEGVSAAGVELEMHWVPRGRVQGNIMADQGAKFARIEQATTLSSSENVLLEFVTGIGVVGERTAINRIMARRTDMAKEIAAYLASPTKQTSTRPALKADAVKSEPVCEAPSIQRLGLGPRTERARARDLPLYPDCWTSLYPDSWVAEPDWQ
ncbi:hypothetical protein FZEAL_4428 [Fusarium zealandicum]|uniref:RNase H type-1 domain-containing protein n=1 Tax=Fusarium zealandicum TaxID=1053134 RepID=A0A8H4UMJ5_9HYPO|nr:hypothetical protein FZEAL_4428 [Fusarium zealandicum]